MMRRTPRSADDTTQRELDRLDMTHLMNVKAVGNKLFLAPLEEEKVHKILDIGTGTGICESMQCSRDQDRC